MWEPIVALGTVVLFITGVFMYLNYRIKQGPRKKNKKKS